MKETVTVKVSSTSIIDGQTDVLHFTGSGLLRKTDYGYQLRYHATNDADGSPMDSDVKWDEENKRIVVIQESGANGYGLLLDPKALTVTRIAEGIDLQVKTTSAVFHIAEHKGYIIMEYRLLTGPELLSKLSVRINLEER